MTVLLLLLLGRWAEMVSPGEGSDYLRHLGAGEMLAFSAADFEDFKEARPDLPKEMESELEPIVRFLASKRWPFRLHATYGESIERELGIFEKLDAEIPGCLQSLRWFIDHAETVAKRDIARIKALGGGIAIQHRMAFQGEYFIKRYGEKEAAHSPPLSLMRQAGVHVGAGTDGTRVATYNPWVSLQWLVTGQTVGGQALYAPNTTGCDPLSNCPSRMDALRMWTADNAWFSFDDQRKGALLPGLYADLAVLKHDYFDLPATQISLTEAEMTMLGGRIVYVDPQAASRYSATTLPPEFSIESITPSWSPVRLFGGYHLAGSTAWPVDPAAVREASSHQAAGTGAVKEAQLDVGSHSTAKATQPEDFFMYGHDC